MSNVNRIHDTKNVKMELTNNSPRKQAGSNNLKLTVNSEDWRISDQKFLNQNLS